MRVLQVVDDTDVVQLDVEVLVDALERAADLDVVLELDGDLVVDQGLEEAASGVSAFRGRGKPGGGGGGGDERTTPSLPVGNGGLDGGKEQQGRHVRRLNRRLWPGGTGGRK